ncbi:periplasmic binding protein-like I [Rhizoclosmatium globosum]|uniref:Periplasmic binding protein-like I n=1 Tax=Rhizoclosmatium globosum TaxID=329046 RepID=A0A1Y2CW91_9FUNG|nr:periplasmic binding protein-like I [Rhizoclosmatium globosum]|eukprot:ORY51293.1 periplasmic binding protein-like I [Rhizoclosmatium globosum]
MAVALQKTNVTIGLVGPYCAVPFVSTSASLVTRYPKTFSRDTIDVFGWSGWAFLNDAVISMAISDINSRPDILPNLQVNIKRFSSCGPYNPTANLKYNGQPIGFASAIMTNDIINVHKDVIAVVGNDISSVAIPTAQILSNNQIPYCSLYAGSPALSDKRIFNYFWPDAVPVFLKSLGVKQVAIVVQKYSSFLLTSQQFIRNVQKEEIRIVASAHIATIITNEQIEYAATVMKRVSARLIKVHKLKSNYFLRICSEAMYKLGKLGFKGSSGIVWFAQNAPNPFYDPLKGI